MTLARRLLRGRAWHEAVADVALHGCGDLARLEQLRRADLGAVVDRCCHLVPQVPCLVLLSLLMRGRRRLVAEEDVRR